MEKVCSKMVLRLLTLEKKETQMNILTNNILQNVENDSNFLGNVIVVVTHDFFQYDVKVSSSHHWNHAFEEQ